MKKNIFTLLFGLLLAVGWTNVSSAQSACVKLADITDWTYTWGDASGNTQTSYYVDQETGKIAEVTDAYQIYGLLKDVYTNPAFPGPYYSAYTASGQREDPVYYGGIDGGWNIPYTSGSSGPAYQPVGDITISVASWYESFHSITVYDANTNAVLTSWNADNGATEEVSTSSGTGINYVMPTGWSTTSTYFLQWDVNGTACAYMNINGAATLTISSSALNGATSVRVVINAVSEATTAGTVTVNGESKTLASTFADYTWNINGAPVVSGSTTPTDVIIRLAGGSFISNITVTSGNTTITRWRGNYEGANLPSGWYASGTLTSAGSNFYSLGGSGVIRIPASLFEGYNSITVSVTGVRYSTSYTGEVWIANDDDDGRSYFTSTSTYSPTTLTSTINFPAKVNENVYKPADEGYTVLLVQVRNTGSIYQEPEAFLGAFEFTDSTSVINYIRNNIKSVQLLTDGMRIGEGEGIGTVYNCSGTYNKFFFLGKGQARKKSSGVLASIGLTSSLGWPSYACEQGPFKFMFEQFSPTGGEEGEQITDFYLEMMDGHVYDVVHDCASVIQQAHQFSMSGNTGTQAYAMSGMNFFVPDYRLKYWTLTDTVGTYGDGSAWVETVDGRDMNPYMVADANGKTGVAYWSASYFAVNYAQYNKQHAPKVGIYTLTLDADAQPCQDYANPGNTNYAVTLDWTSSLNEMSGTNVPQTYVIYEVVDSMGVHTLVPIDTVKGTTHYDFPDLFPQGDHSVTHTYIIMGWPTTSTHPEFIAWSNEDAVVIPGLNDFLMLNLGHYESDFDVPNMQNWYRNFLIVNNDGYVGLTTQGINEGDSVFNLVRFENVDTTVTKQVAKLKFENQNNGTVKYTVQYIDENGENTQEIEPDGHTHDGTPLSYQRLAMGIVDEGYLTIKADGDIIIQPNGYDVNFLSIHVQAGSYNQTWTSSQGALPTGWSVSDGSRWVLEEGAYYLEGGGYVLIPASVIGNYTTATVTINAYGDAGKTAKIAVNGTSKGILNGEENARDYEWTINNGAKLNAPTRAAETTYQKVTTTADLTDGQYLIICETNNRAMNGALTTYDASANYISVSISDGVINATTATEAAEFTINKSGNYYTIQGAGGRYMGRNSNSNGIDASTTALNNTISFNNGNAIITGTGSRVLWFNAPTSSNRFRYLSANASGAYRVQLYKKVSGVEPAVDGTVRIANLRLVDQFNEEIPNANNHPYRYTYILKLANSDKESSYVPVPVQHTGAEIEGYYTHAEMKGDIDPANFLETNIISAELDMNLSPTSAPYYYTVNSVENGVPQSADEYESYLRVLQRRSAGDYQERQGKYNNTVVNPDMDSVYTAGEHDFFDYRKVVAPDVEYFLSYAPIVWTNGIDRHYYVDDSLHNSYGAPIWEVRRGDVIVNKDGTVCQKQARKDANGNWVWNNSVNYTLDGTDYCLYFVSVDAQGILPVGNVEYEPYMFRLWLVDSAASMRNYTWELNDKGKPVKIVDAGPYTENGGMWKLLDTKMCENWDNQNFDPDLNYVVSIVDGNAENHSWSENIAFVGPMNGFNPKLYVRFYYKIKGAVDNTIGMRGINDDDNVGYVVLRGVNPDPGTAVHEIVITGEVESQTFYNVQGMQSDKPFDGINIVVTRYSNGATTTTKVRY